MNRLACVQEQRLPITDGRVSPVSSQSSTFTAGPSSEEFTSDSTCQAQSHNKVSLLPVANLSLEIAAILH